MDGRPRALRDSLMVGVILLILGSVTPLHAQACLGQYPCWESPGFTIRVIDRQTQEPLAGVHALAEWIAYGGFGRRGIFMAQEAVSGADGWLVFPPWGPFRGYEPGMLGLHDPAITLFRPGYLPELEHGRRVIYNATPPDQTELTRVRRFGRDGATFGMEPFRGDTATWVAHLREAARPNFGAGANDVETARIRTPMGNRMDRVQEELAKQPQDREDVQRLAASLKRSREDWR
jgi:hypothetical protein